MKLFSDIQNLLKVEFEAVNTLILDSLNIEKPLVQEIGQHIVSSGGKRTRPLLVLLIAKALNHFHSDHIKLAAIIELIHTVTLLHDDVVDNSKLRHGKNTANFIWGNEASILVGDFLYSRAFQMMAELNNLEIIKIFAKTTNKIAAGEVLQLSHRNSISTSEATYMEIIQGKTGALFETSTGLSAIIAQAKLEQQKQLTQYGLHLGNAFQIIDDVLDYEGKETELGKKAGDDLSEGKATLPLIYALSKCNPSQKDMIKTAIARGDLNPLDDILNLIQDKGGLEYAKERAQKEMLLAQKALTTLSPSQYKDALFSMTQIILKRTY
jgi:octaprenyl-diphosphate synthase